MLNRTHNQRPGYLSTKHPSFSYPPIGTERHECIYLGGVINLLKILDDLDDAVGDLALVKERALGLF